MNNVIRGTKYTNYVRKIPIDKPKYDGDIFEKIPHNKVIGKYIDVLENVGRYNQNMYIIDSDRTDGLFDKIFGYASLDRQMKEVNSQKIQGNKNIPELRFPEFEGEWITYKLCDVVTRIIRKNKNFIVLLVIHLILQTLILAINYLVI